MGMNFIFNLVILTVFVSGLHINAILLWYNPKFKNCKNEKKAKN